MTVHMIRVVASSAGDYTLDQLNTAMDDWVSKQSEWTNDTKEHVIEDARDGDTGDPLGHRDGTYRFLIEDAKDNLLQKCEDKLVNKVDWYRIGYHECNHDETGRDGCPWDEQREWTDKDATIPDHVPVFIEDAISPPVATLSAETPAPSLDSSGGT